MNQKPIDLYQFVQRLKFYVHFLIMLIEPLNHLNSAYSIMNKQLAGEKME